MKMALEM